MCCVLIKKVSCLCACFSFYSTSRISSELMAAFHLVVSVICNRRKLKHSFSKSSLPPNKKIEWLHDVRTVYSFHSQFLGYPQGFRFFYRCPFTRKSNHTRTQHNRTLCGSVSFISPSTDEVSCLAISFCKRNTTRRRINCCYICWYCALLPHRQGACNWQRCRQNTAKWT
jgi:hypothetical protein